MWFSYSFSDGFETHASAAEAEAAAVRSMESEREYARADGEWSDSADDVCWGRIHEKAQITTEFDNGVDIDLVPVSEPDSDQQSAGARQ